jgi:multidrug efflux pump subunit AcrA (membrane-fusion protein)
MTANANLLTVQREDVLLLPSQAIIADRTAGRFYVNLVVGEGQSTDGSSAQPAVERVEVVIGLRDDHNTQILEGLQAGDRVQISNVSPRSNPFEDD